MLMLYKNTSLNQKPQIWTKPPLQIALIDRNVTENRKTTSGQALHFHRGVESNKTLTASPGKTCDEVNLFATTNNITATARNVP